MCAKKIDDVVLDALRIRKKPLVARVKEALLDFIKSNNLEGSLLPSEIALYKAIGVSRTTLRNAMAILEMDGVIFKKHGVGTYVSKNALKPRVRLNEAPEFSALIHSFGYKSDIEFISHTIRNNLDEINIKLGRNTGENILSVYKNFLADGKPAIHCIDHVPLDVIKEDFVESDLKKPIFDFLREKCDEEVIYLATKILPMIVNDELTGYIGMDGGKPIIMFSEIGFNKNDRAILFAEEYYQPDMIEMNIIRKKV
jgi:GntR family transcriptional regulator